MTEGNLGKKLDEICGLMPDDWEFNVIIYGNTGGYDANLVDDEGNQVEFQSNGGLEEDVDGCLEYLREMRREGDNWKDFKMTDDVE